MHVADEVVGHGEVLSGLWRAAAANRLPHALTFEGPAGIGKYTAAVRFANGLLCERGPGEPCGECGPCKRVRSGNWRGNHPDLFPIDPVEEARDEQSKGKRVVTVRIKLGRIAIRDGNEDCAEGFLRLVSVEGGWRIVLVRDAHLMAADAQNALLKTLEEPGDSTLLVLVADRPGDLLPTIRSRCVRVHFDSLSEADAGGLLASHGIDPERAGQLARWTGGAPGEALRLDGEGAPETRTLIEDALAGRVGPLDGAAALWELPGEFLGSTPTAQARLRARSALDLVVAVASDFLRYAGGVSSGGLAHGDVAERVGAEIGEVRARWLVDRALALRSSLDANVTPEAAVERTFLALARGSALIVG